MRIISSNQNFKTMKTNLAKLASYFYKAVTVNDVLKEAVMNSIQANATVIDIVLQYQYEQTIDGDSYNLGNLEKIIITDNGDGLTEKNINAFFELATTHKENIGGKGIGRISFLKIASKIRIESFSNENTHVEFDFNYDTEKGDIVTSACKGEDSRTSIFLSDLDLKHPKTHAASCASSLREKFNLMLFLKQKETGKNISINLFVNTGKIDEINSNDMKCLDEVPYRSNDCEFMIYVFQNKEKQGVFISYYANNIQVNSLAINKNFSTQYVFAITSEFFDQNVNVERTRFDFRNNDDELINLDMWSGSPNKDFEKELQQQCLNIVHKNEPNLKKENQARLKELKEKYGYINLDGIDLESVYFDEQEILSSYRNDRNREEDQLVAMLNDSKTPMDELLSKVSEQNKHELAKYIFHRDWIAKEGLRLTKSKENEDVWHNLFFPQKTSSKSNENNLYENSIWLLDDKFMSYTYTASDIAMNRIHSEIGDKSTSCSSKERPDLFILYNNPEDSDSFKDVVLIEFKKGSINYKNKTLAIEQLVEYKQITSEIVSNISNFYCYIICDFDASDKKLETAMVDRTFTKVLSNKGCMYYGYLLGSQTHITFVSSESVFADAVARNKTFLNILMNAKS